MTTPGTVPAQPPPSTGDEREDQAAIAAAEVAAILTAATAAILAAIAAAIATVVAGSLSVQMAKRKIRRTIAATLGAASMKLGPVYEKAAEEAQAGGERAGTPVPKGIEKGLPPGTHAGRSRRHGPPSLPDAPEQISRAILAAQQDAGQAFDAAMAAALGGKGSPLPPPGSPYHDAVEKAMRRLTGIGADVKDLSGPERARLSLSRLQAAQVVMDDLAGKGLTGFTDSAGRRWSLDAYAEMATRTAASRMHLSSQLGMMAQAGNDLVIVDNPSMEAACPLCVLPGTVVEGPAPEWRVRTEYAGDVVSITTAGGKYLTGTPDHTVLTPQGWRCLKDLQPGDEVISNAGQQVALPAAAWGEVGVVVPDDVQMPALIEDAGETRTPLLLAGPARRELDSDIAYREVQVVWPDRLLLDEGDAALAKPAGDLLLIGGVGGADLSLAGSNLLPLLKSLRYSPAGSMGRSKHGGTLIGGSDRPALAHEGGPLLTQDAWIHALDRLHSADPLWPCLDLRQAEVVGHAATTDSEGGAQFVHGLAGEVAPDQFGRLRVGELPGTDSLRYRRHAARGEDLQSPRVADVEGGLELLERLAGSVAADEVVSVNVGHYAGHVWDLQTAPSWYLTSGIVSHNCRPYEGKVLSLRGESGGLSTITDANGPMRTVSVAGTLAQAVSHGLLHPQCRHSLIPWTDGAGAVATAGGAPRGYVQNGVPVYRSLPIGTDQDYRNAQKLRAHERNVRRASMRVAGALTPQAKRQARAHLAHARGGLEEHVRTTGVTRLRGRERAGRAR